MATPRFTPDVDIHTPPIPLTTSISESAASRRTRIIIVLSGNPRLSKRGRKKAARRQEPLAGARFCGNVQTLADCGPPGQCQGNKTLRDGISGIGPSGLLLRRGRQWYELGWRSYMLSLARYAATHAASCLAEWVR